jgi:hypothetical protein
MTYSRQAQCPEYEPESPCKSNIIGSFNFKAWVKNEAILDANYAKLLLTEIYFQWFAILSHTS